MHTLPVKKAVLGELEVKLFTGKASLSDMAFLLETYTDAGLTAQAARVHAALGHRLAASPPSAHTLYVKTNALAEQSGSVRVFPFMADVFMTASPDFGVARLARLIRRAECREVVVDRRAAEHPQAVGFIRRLCLERGIPCRVTGEREESPLLFDQLLPVGEDARMVREKLSMPSEIMLPTFMGTCNIQCRFCEQAFRSFPNRTVDFDTFQSAVRAIPERTRIKTGLTPFQEPLVIFKPFRPYMAFALKERPDAHIGFNTNGSLLTAEKSRQLVDMGLKYIVISLNMPDAESYRWFTGKNFFDVTARNIKTLREIRSQRNSRFPHTIVQFLRVPPVTGNEDRIRAEWSAWADEIYFRNVSAPTGDPAKLQELKERCPDLLETQQVREEGVPCASMFATCAIDMQGYYTPCCLINRTRKEAGTRKYRFMEAGHVRDMDVLTAWRSPKWQQLRAWQAAGLLKQCRGCTINQADTHYLDRLHDGLAELSSSSLPRH